MARVGLVADGVFRRVGGLEDCSRATRPLP